LQVIVLPSQRARLTPSDRIETPIRRLAHNVRLAGERSIRSEQRLCEEVHLNLAYRWFRRLGLDGTFPILDVLKEPAWPLS
jgi:hypothetical protein